MATIDYHALFHRNDVRAWLCAFALGCFFLSAQAATAPNFGRQPINYGGRTTTFGPIGPADGSSVPISPSIGGWSQAGNFGFPTGPTGPTIGHIVNGEFVVGGSAGGVKYPFTGTSSLSREALVAGIGTMGCSFVTGGILTVACTLAVPFVYKWITDAGARRNPDTGALEHADSSSCTQAPCYTFSTPIAGATFWPTAQQACVQFAQLQNAQGGYYWWGNPQALGSVPANFQCTFDRNAANADHTGGQGGIDHPMVGMTTQDAPPSAGGWVPYTTNDQFLQALRNTAPDGRVAGEILGQGGTITMPNPVVTGPTTINGPTTVTVNNDGSRTTTTTVNNYTTNNNSVVNTGQTSTKTVTNADGTTRSVDSTTTTPTDSEDAKPKDPCAANPDRVGCQDIDVPEGKIPRENKTITFTPEDSFGGGSCPADRYWSSSLMPGTYKVVDWSTFCANAVAVRALVLLLATFAAFLIVMPGKEVRT